jgi:hypothetical protein
MMTAKRGSHNSISAKKQAKPTRVTIPALFLAITLVAALSDQGQAQKPVDKPAYCSGPGAYRLSECGLTEKQALEAEAAAAAGRSPRASSGDHTDAAFQYLSQQAKKICDSKPVSQMTMEDIEDCNKPGMRLLRQR